VSARPSLESLARPHIRELRSYQPGKPLEELERELGITNAVKLASNESPLPPSPRVIEAVERALRSVNRYPEDSCFKIRAALARHLGVQGQNLIFGAGSDEILGLLGSVFLDPGDEVVFSWPSFAMYPIITQSMGARAVMVKPGPGYRSDPDALADAVTPRTKLLMLANPNNPTGTSMNARELAHLLARVPEHVIVALDEAYYEYVRSEDYPRSLELIAERPTVIALRTFSKIYGLAGLRIGYGIGHPELTQLLERARHPFNVSSIAQAAAVAALEDDAYREKVREVAHQGLTQLEAGFEKLGLTCVPSDANFVLVDVGRESAPLEQALQRRGVIVRPMQGFGLTRHLRITAGLPEENQRVLDALAAELERR
jgi:histidinol-phosphate aminotransferase